MSQDKAGTPPASPAATDTPAPAASSSSGSTTADTPAAGTAPTAASASSADAAKAAKPAAPAPVAPPQPEIKPVEFQVREYPAGIRINCQEGINLRQAEALHKQFADKPGIIVLDFGGRSGVDLGALKVLAHFAAKVMKPKERTMYFLRASEELANLVRNQGLDALLKLAAKTTMIPGMPAEPNTVPRMDLRFVNLFIDSAIKTFQVQCNVKAAPQKPYMLDQGAPIHGDIIGLINLSTETTRGEIAVSMEKKSFLYVMSTMLGEPQSEVNVDLENGAKELFGVIYSQARIALTQEGFVIPKSGPGLIKQDGAPITQAIAGGVLIMPLLTDGGVINVGIGI